MEREVVCNGVSAKELDCEMKPHLGQEVYAVNVDGKEIYRMKVYAIGEDFFIPEGFLKMNAPWQVIRFDEYGKRWFMTEQGAKEELSCYLTDDEVIVEGDNDCTWWYAERL